MVVSLIIHIFDPNQLKQTKMNNIKDSEGKTYGVDVMDMLAKIYRFLVIHELAFTVDKAFLADCTLSMGTGGNWKVAEKFIKELEYVKQLVAAQPVITYTVEYLEQVVVDHRGGEYVPTGEIEVFVNRTFDSHKMNSFVQGVKSEKYRVGASHQYKSYRIKNVEEINKENLQDSK